MNIATTLHLKTMHGAGGACEFEKVIWTILKNSKKTADDDDDEEEERIKSEDHTRWHDDILTSFSWWITFSPFCDKAWKRWVPWNWWTTKMHHRVSQKISFFHDSWAFREIEWVLIVVSVQIILNVWILKWSCKKDFKRNILNLSHRMFKTVHQIYTKKKTGRKMPTKNLLFATYFRNIGWSLKSLSYNTHATWIPSQRNQEVMTPMLCW